MRFELSSLEFCRKWSTHNENSSYSRNYYGFGCTNPSLVNTQEQYKLFFSPILEGAMKNYFHCDIYDKKKSAIQVGVAQDAEVNYRIEEFKKIWNSYSDIEISSRLIVQPPERPS